MTQEEPGQRIVKVLLVLASLVILIAGIKAAGSLFVMILLAVFIAIISAPPMHWLENKGVPPLLAMLMVMLVVVGLSLLMVSFVGASITDFTRSMPEYEEKWTDQIRALAELLKGFGVELSTDMLKQYFDPGVAMQMVARFFSGLSETLANVFVIFLLVVFMLLESSSIPHKLVAAFGLDESSRAMENFEKVTRGVNRYLAIKTVVSLATGVIIAGWLAILGVDYPILWGLVAFMMNYIPNIGSMIAAIPAVLLALIQLNVPTTLLVAAGYMVVNVVMGNIVEPRVMGRGVGLSTLVVFMSLVLWGWVLGPVGMLLSVPLSMVAKIILESNPETRWIAVLLGSDAEARALEAESHQSHGDEMAEPPAPDAVEPLRDVDSEGYWKDAP